jgi:hypothetical protein
MKTERVVVSPAVFGYWEESCCSHYIAIEQDGAPEHFELSEDLIRCRSSVSPGIFLLPNELRLILPSILLPIRIFRD